MLVGAVVFGLLLFGAFLLSSQLLRPEPQPHSVGTAVLFVIQAPTGTPLISSVLPKSTPTPAPQADVSGQPIAVGLYVQVTGTDVDGLRLRGEPGLESEIRFVAIEAEVFQVLDGPREVDGYTWWYIQGPYDPNVHGWAVAQYLGVIQRNP